MKPLVQYLCLVPVVLICASCRSAPRPIGEIAGCYFVGVGGWRLHPRSLTQPTRPPGMIRLTSELISDRSTNRYRVLPHAFDDSTRGAASYWSRSGDSVVIDWSVAFADVQMRVTPTSIGLAGVVESQTDVVVSDEHGQIPWPSAKVRLRRIRCSRADAA